MVIGCLPPYDVICFTFVATPTNAPKEVKVKINDEEFVSKYPLEVKKTEEGEFYTFEKYQ